MRIFVVGGGHSTFMGKARPEFVPRGNNPDELDHLRDALAAATEATGVPLEAVDRVFLSNFLGECFLKQGHMGALLPEVAPALSGKPITRVEAACASGSAAISACADALHGSADIALAVGVEIETNVRGSEGVDYMNRAAWIRTQSSLDTFLFPHLFARRARAYKERFGATEEDIGAVVVKAYTNATDNPKALNQAVSMDLASAVEVSDHNYVFLDDEALRPHIKLNDCTHFADGASAVFLANERGLEKLGIDPSQTTELVGIGHSVAAIGATTDPTQMTNMAAAAAAAYAQAGITPDAIDIAEVHDCFSVSELQVLDAVLQSPGAALALQRAGETQRSGALPVNTGGGLIGFGHPIGATGIKQTVEIWRQMKRRCGAYQVGDTPVYGITANLGGDDRTGIVMVHRNL